MKTSGIIFLFLLSLYGLYGQPASTFDSFVDKLEKKYHVYVAIAPELIPEIDSLIDSGADIENIRDLLDHLLKENNYTYRIIDGNKLLLRREELIIIGKEDVQLSGIVLDKNTQAPLPYSAVTIPGTGRGTFTNDEGHFNLYTDAKTQFIQVSYLGYKPVTMAVGDLKSNGAVIMLEEDQVPLEEVVIVVPFHSIQEDIHSQSLELKGYQLISEDDILARNTNMLISRLNGYTHYSSEEGIRIRGSEQENSLFVMDGIPVYDPYHFYNIFSPFNGHYFSSVQLYKNNLPVEYGGRIDGLIKLETAKDRSSHMIIDNDLLLTSVSGQINVKDKIIISGSGRVSHTETLGNSLQDSTTSSFQLPGVFRDDNEWTTSQEPNFNFYDINLGLSAPIGSSVRLNLAYFRNRDHLDNLINTGLSITAQEMEVISIKQEVFSHDLWKNEGASASMRVALDSSASLYLDGFLTSFEKSVNYDAIREDQIFSIFRSLSNTGLQNSSLESAGIKAYLRKSLPGNKEMLLGADIQQHEVDLIASENLMPYLLEVQKENEASLFGEYSFYIADKLNVAPGGRITYLNSTSDFYPLPGIRIHYLLNDTWYLKSAFSKNIQAVRELKVENRFGRKVEFLALSQPEAGYPVMESDKYMLGAGLTSEKLSLDGELYYKKSRGLMSVRAPRPNPSFDAVSAPQDFYRLFTGDGWTAGFDLTGVYKTQRVESTLSYTLSKISQRFDGLFKGESFSPTEDRRHQFKFSSLYKIGNVSLSGLFNYKTKAPYVSFNLIDRDGGLGGADRASVIKYLPPYFSLDLAIDYTFKIGNETGMIGVSVINATDHENVNELQHIGRLPAGIQMSDIFLTHQTELLGRTFNVHFAILVH